VESFIRQASRSESVAEQSPAPAESGT